jgi:tetrahydromethanopterin S-methyltransferase subunit H
MREWSPPLAVGSLFYWSQEIVRDPKGGVFDREEARRLLGLQEELGRRYGLDPAVDIVAQTPRAMVRYIDFVSEETERPFLIDSIDPTTRLAGARHAVEVGLGGRAVYNSIAPWTRGEELAHLRETGLPSALLFLAQEGRERSRSLTPREKWTLLQGEGGLLGKAGEAGITDPWVDLLLLEGRDLSRNRGLLRRVKGELGLLAGCGTGNLLARKGSSLEERRGRMAGANTVAACHGYDFLLYGPIEGAPWIFPALRLGRGLLEEEAGPGVVRPR